MNKVFFVLEKERDRYTGKEHSILYVYVSLKSLLWLENVSFEIGTEEEKSFRLDYTVNGNVSSYESSKDDKKVFTFLNKLIKKKFYYYNVRIININNIIKVDDIENIYSLELFNEKLKFQTNGVQYDF